MDRNHLGCEKKDSGRKMDFWRSIGWWLSCKYKKPQLAVDYTRRAFIGSDK